MTLVVWNRCLCVGIVFTENSRMSTKCVPGSWVYSRKRILREFSKFSISRLEPEYLNTFQKTLIYRLIDWPFNIFSLKVVQYLAFGFGFSSYDVPSQSASELVGLDWTAKVQPRFNIGRLSERGKSVPFLEINLVIKIFINSSFSGRPRGHASAMASLLWTIHRHHALRRPIFADCIIGNMQCWCWCYY